MERVQQPLDYGMWTNCLRLLRRRLPWCPCIVVSAVCIFLSHSIPGCHSALETETRIRTEYTVLQHRADRLVVELPNRMIVIAQELRAAPVVSAQIWVKTGSIYEQEYVGAGLSHFLEHLVAGGSTSSRTEEESNTLLGQMGAQVNAATGLDTVHYYINTTRDHTVTAIELLSDWIRHSQITDTEYQREREVIQSEFGHGMGDPGRIFWKLTQQARYVAHPARHPTIGYLDEFLKISRDEIYAFYRRMYVPNNLLFVVAGDLDKQQVVDQITRLWSDQPASPLPDLNFPVEPEINQPRTFTGYADIDKPRLRLVWPGTKLTGTGDYELDLLAVVLGQGESSRLVRNVRDEQRLVNTIDAYNLSFSWGRGFFGVDAEVAVPPIPPNVRTTPVQWRNKWIGEAKKAVLDQVQAVFNHPVTEAELARAKRKVLASVVQANQTASAIAQRLARDSIGMGDPDYLFGYAKAVQLLDVEQLHRAAQLFLDDTRLITVELLPQPDGHTAKPPSRPLKTSDAADLEHTSIELDNSRILDQLRQSTSLDLDRTLTIEPLVRFQLSNGLRLLVQRSTVVPAVAMQVYSLGGLLGDELGREGVANAVAEMTMRGSSTRSAESIAEAIEDLGANLSVQAGNNSTYARATALSEDWPKLLELMADLILNPSFPDDQWQKLQPRLVAAIERQSDRWSGELAEHFRLVYHGDHPWSQSPLGRKEIVSALTVDDLRAYHAAHLGAEDTVVVVVGDVDPMVVRREVERCFVAMPRRAMVVFNPLQPPEPQGLLVQHQTDKALAAVKIGFGPGVKRTDPDYPELLVLARVLSDFPSGWLERQLRGEGEGLSYAIGAWVQTGLVPGHFAILFNTREEVAVEALTRSMSVVDRATNELVDEADLARAKAKVLTSKFLSKQSNSSRAAEAALDELYGVRDPQAERFIQQVRAVDASRLRELARQYLRNPVVVVISNQLIDEQLLTEALGR